MRVYCAAVAVLFFAASASAQPVPASSSPPPAEPAQPSSPAPTAAPAAPADLHLAADTPVRIELGEAVSSKDRKDGDKFAIRLAPPIVVDGRIVAPAGSPGQGEVIYAERGGGGGKPGKLVLAVRYIDVGGVHIRLKALQLGAGGDSEF